MNEYKVTILGAGLAGCEAALWLAGKGVQVELYEQKPVHFSPAHKSEGFAELICSNSLKAERLDSASGLLKEEMRRMGSRLLTAEPSFLRFISLNSYYLVIISVRTRRLMQRRARYIWGDNWEIS